MHETTSHIDGGAVNHQTAALQMHAEDGLHDLAARTVKTYADEIPDLLRPHCKVFCPLENSKRHLEKFGLALTGGRNICH